MGPQLRVVVKPNRPPPLAVSDADRAAWDAGGYAMLERVTVSGTADQVAARLNDLAAGGVTELVFQPFGPDIRRELETFMAAARATVNA